MNILIYAGVFLFGAVALLIEARRNYRASLTQQPFQRHPILQNAQVSDLCTPRDGFVGFVIYSMLYLVSYLIILSSAELYELIRNANMAKLEVGATDAFDPFGNDVLNLQGTVYAKPIFVSAFLIAVMSIGAMKPIENTVRSAAHRLAGIPRGVYRVIDTLQTPAFLRLAKGRQSGILSDYYKAKMHAAADALPADLAGYAQEIERALGAIDVLSNAVAPNRRAQHFPAADLDKLTDMSAQLHGDLSDLRKELKSFDPTEEGALRDLYEHATRTANNTKALFAVHYIRNNRSVKNLDPTTPLAKTVRVIDRNYNPEQNSFALAAFVSGLISLVLIFGAYYGWHSQAVNSWPGLADRQLETIVERNDTSAWNQQRGAQGPPTPQRMRTDRIVEICIAHVSAPEGSGPPLEERQQADCSAWVTEAQGTYIFDVRTELAKQAFWDTLQAALIAFMAVTATTFGREVRLEQESWKTGWSFKRIPFLRLFGLCLIPSAFAFMGAVAGSLLELLFDSNFGVTQTQILQLFESNTAYFALSPLVGFILAFGALTILDKHEDLSALMTLICLALPTACVVIFIWAGVVFFDYSFRDVTPFCDRLEQCWLTYKTRDGFILAILPVIFIVCFALLIEVTEETDPDDPDAPPPGWMSKLIHRRESAVENDRVAAE